MIILLSALAPAVARGQHFYFQKYTVNDGLPDSYILRVYPDREGFLWIGTAGGLSRFDGEEFINYGYEAGLPDLRIDAICEDHTGRMWAGTRRGIVEVRGRECVARSCDDGLVPSFVFQIREGRDGAVRACTDKGLYRWDGGQWRKERPVHGMEDHVVRDVVDAPEGRYLNFGELLILQRPGLKDSIVGKRSSDPDYYNEMRSAGGRIVVSLPHGLMALDGGSGLSGGPALAGWPSDGPALAGFPVFARVLGARQLGHFFCDTHRRFWINTEDAGLLVSAASGAIVDTIHVQGNLVSDMCEDEHGNIWLAGLDGLLKVAAVHHTEFDRAGCRTLVGMSELIPVHGLLAVGAHGLAEFRGGANGLAEFQRGAQGLAALRREALAGQDAFLPLDVAGWPGGPVDGWCTDPHGDIWLMTREQGLFVKSKTDLKRIAIPVNDPMGNNRGIACSRLDGKIYLCVDTLLLYGDQKGFHVWRDAVSGKEIVHPVSVVSLDDGSMLVWTTNNGFFLLDTSGRARDITSAFGLPKVNQRVRFYSRGDGRTWILFNGGLARYHWTHGQSPVKELELTARDGLPGEAVNAMTEDDAGRLWVATSAGIVVVDTGHTCDHRPVMNMVSSEEGLHEDQWNNIGLLTDSAGMIWVRLPNRLVRLDPRLIHFDHRAPHTVIETIQCGRQSASSWRPYADSLYGYRQLPGRLNLPYTLNDLTIGWRSPGFSDEKDGGRTFGMEYSYKLAGFDEQWSVPGSNSSVSFGGLAAGTYHFRVRARLPGTEWGPSAEFSFVIARPWWEGWVFRSAMVLIGLTMTGGLFRWRLRQYQRKARLREQLRELELTALRAQMNPHFIYNALNSIQALVLDDEPEKASLYISRFGRLLRQVLHDSDRPVIPLAQELEALEGYLQLEQLRLHIDLHYQILTAPDVRPDQEGVPPLVLQPYVENALWHGLSRKAGSKRLDILLRLEEEWLVMEVVDNGIGRAAAAAWRDGDKKPKGMEITGRRIREYNGGGSVHTEDLYTSAGEAEGTKVVVRIRRRTV